MVSTNGLLLEIESYARSFEVELTIEIFAVPDVTVRAVALDVRTENETLPRVTDELDEAIATEQHG